MGRNNWLAFIQRPLGARAGQSLTEYGLLLALTTVVCIVGAQALGLGITVPFNQIMAILVDAMDG